MKPVMQVRITEKTPGITFSTRTVTAFQGVVTLPSLATTYLRKENGSTFYATVSNLKQAAVAAARKYNATLNFVVPNKVAAKKTSK